MKMEEIVLTRSQKRAAIRVLKGAKIVLRERREDWVCPALSKAARDTEEEMMANKIRELISCRLGEWNWVTTWLNREGIPAEQVRQYAREYRLLWIDSMVKEVKSLKGLCNV